MNHTVNLAIQMLPLRLSKEETYRIVDVAIAEIGKSGLKYVVCPFETVVEGPYKEVMLLLEKIQTACTEAGADEFIINMKLHRAAREDMKIDDKIGKYKE